MALIWGSSVNKNCKLAFILIVIATSGKPSCRTQNKRLDLGLKGHKLADYAV